MEFRDSRAAAIAPLRIGFAAGIYIYSKRKPGFSQWPPDPRGPGHPAYMESGPWVRSDDGRAI